MPISSLRGTRTLLVGLSPILFYSTDSWNCYVNDTNPISHPPALQLWYQDVMLHVFICLQSEVPDNLCFTILHDIVSFVLFYDSDLWFATFLANVPVQHSCNFMLTFVVTTIKVLPLGSWTLLLRWFASILDLKLGLWIKETEKYFSSSAIEVRVALPRLDWYQ